MEVKIGKYTLKSDYLSAWIEEEFVIQEGKNKGKTTQRRVTGYFRDLGLLLDDFIDTKAKDNDAEDMTQALAEIETALKDAKKIARAAVKEDFHIIRERK